MKKPRLRGLGMGVAVLGISAPLRAQTPPPAGSTPPPSLEVDVKGTPIDLPKTGESATIITREAIESVPGGDGQSLGYVINTQPGMVPDTFGWGSHVRAADGGLIYVLDGIPLQAVPLTQLGSSGGFVPLRMIDKIKLVTGGLPAEYGTALGGVVDIQTRRSLGGPSGEVKAAYGTYQTADLAASYSQQIGKLGVIASGTFVTTQRGLDPPAPSPILHDAMTGGSGFARVDYAFNGHERIEVLGAFTVSHFQVPIDTLLSPLSSGPRGAIRGPDVYGNPPTTFIPYDANPLLDDRNVFASVAYRTSRDRASVTVAPFFRENGSTLSCDPTRALGATADPGAQCDDLDRTAYHGGAIVDVRWPLGEHHAWKAGAQADFSVNRSIYTSYTRDDASPTGGPNPALTLTGTDVTNTLLADVYVQDQITLGDWTLLPGLRVDVQQSSFLQTGESPLILGGPSPRLGVSWSPNHAIVVHGYAGYLVSLPNVADGAAAARILVPAYQHQNLPVDLKTEKAWVGEIGVKGRIAELLTLGLTGWAHYATDQLDRQTIGSTNIFATYNFAVGREAGAEVSSNLAWRYVDGLANLSYQVGQGKGFESERYLFSPAQLAVTGWQTLDHTQRWTANVGADVHDASKRTHLSALVNYGSGLRTGPTVQASLPAHAVLDVTLRHRLEWGVVKPEVAIDVLNALDEVWAYRIATAWAGSAFAAGRRVNVRVSVPFGG
jgi:hypothetical protein